MKIRIIFTGLLALLASSAYSASSEWNTNAHGKVRLVSPYNVAPQSGEIIFGVHFLPEPGWVVYWKNAGDAGYAPKFDFKGSRGIDNPEVLWPRPKFFLLPGGIKEYGYDEPVIYPVKARILWGKYMRIEADVNYLTCKESCIPYHYTLSLEMSQAEKPQPDIELAAAIERFVSRVPPAGEDVVASLRPQAVGGGEVPNFWWIMLLGFIGGVILNVMPCVLPVLSIKLFGLLQHGGRDRRIVVRDSLASAAGIIFSFLAGAALLVVAQTAGKAVGWGIQFQNPGFIAFLFVVVLLFALNLWGIFEITLPPALASLGTLGQDDDGPLSFFTAGMFATLLATPCSAPFLGTAIGFALSQSSVVTLAIFGAAGVGMALPYLGLAVFPGTLRLLPRPGIWMSKLKIILGLLLFATALWLAWVFAHQVKWIKPSAIASVDGIQWIPFDEKKIQEFVAAGKPVFVDVTADWCVTCKVNERFVIQSAEVVAEFKRRDVVMMKADWTHHDDAIGDYLKRHGRAGIPFYALYYPYKGPIVLSELLTKKQVLDTLRTLDTH